jgi:hypothetical protein
MWTKLVVLVFVVLDLVLLLPFLRVSGHYQDDEDSPTCL